MFKRLVRLVVGVSDPPRNLSGAQASSRNHGTLSLEAHLKFSSSNTPLLCHSLVLFTDVRMTTCHWILAAPLASIRRPLHSPQCLTIVIILYEALLEGSLSRRSSLSLIVMLRRFRGAFRTSTSTSRSWTWGGITQLSGAAFAALRLFRARASCSASFAQCSFRRAASSSGLFNPDGTELPASACTSWPTSCLW